MHMHMYMHMHMHTQRHRHMHGHKTQTRGKTHTPYVTNTMPYIEGVIESPDTIESPETHPCKRIGRSTRLVRLIHCPSNICRSILRSNLRGDFALKRTVTARPCENTHTYTHNKQKQRQTNSTREHTLNTCTPACRRQCQVPTR